MIVAQSYTIGGRWVLLFECLWLPAMALLPPRLVVTARSPRLSGALEDLNLSP
jgi:hypothetical protein